MKWQLWHLTIGKHMNIWEWLSKKFTILTSLRLIFPSEQLIKTLIFLTLWEILRSSLRLIITIFIPKSSCKNQQKQSRLKLLESINSLTLYELMVLETCSKWWSSSIKRLSECSFWFLIFLLMNRSAQLCLLNKSSLEETKRS